MYTLTSETVKYFEEGRMIWEYKIEAAEKAEIIAQFEKTGTAYEVEGLEAEIEAAATAAGYEFQVTDEEYGNVHGIIEGGASGKFVEVTILKAGGYVVNTVQEDYVHDIDSVMEKNVRKIAKMKTLVKYLDKHLD